MTELSISSRAAGTANTELAATRAAGRDDARGDPGAGADSVAHAAAPPSSSSPLMSTINVRSLSLAVIAVLACLYTMHWARAVLIPIALGVMLSYALTPIVKAAYRWRIPRAVSSTVLLGAIVAGIGWGAWSLSDQADDLLDKLPTATESIRRLMRDHEGPSAFDKVQRAAAELEAVANAGGASAPPARPGARAPVPVRRPVEAPTLDVRAYLLSGTLGALAVFGQMAVVIFIALFLLASGDSFRRKMVKLAGPRLSQKKVTVETLDEISNQIQRYLLVQVGVSVVVGVLTWLAFLAIGLQQSAVWGVVAGITNLIPYLGAVLVGGGSTIVGLVQFGTLGMAILVGGTSFAIHTVVGNVLTPWLTGRASQMSPVAVFIAVLVFGWLWGVSGLLLGVPILLVIKSVCDRIDDLKPIGELLGT